MNEFVVIESIVRCLHVHCTYLPSQCSVSCAIYVVSPLPDVPHQKWPLGRFPSPSISAMGDTRFFASSETRIPTQHSQCHLLCPQQPRNSTQLLVDLNVKSPSPRKSTCLDAPCLNPSPVLTPHRATLARRRYLQHTLIFAASLTHHFRLYYTANTLT